MIQKQIPEIVLTQNTDDMSILVSIKNKSSDVETLTHRIGQPTRIINHKTYAKPILVVFLCSAVGGCYYLKRAFLLVRMVKT